jgi:hypothetical protein
MACRSVSPSRSLGRRQLAVNQFEIDFTLRTSTPSPFGLISSASCEVWRLKSTARGRPGGICPPGPFRHLGVRAAVDGERRAGESPFSR